MTEADLSSFNLNLLVPLHALLRYRSVTAAARSLHIGQPAMSTTLAKLRQHYGDDLLVRVGNDYQLTRLAQSLVDSVGMALELSGQALAAREASLDPGSLHRTFTIGLAEAELTLLAGEILSRVRAQAPHVQVAFDLNRAAQSQDLASRIRQVDLLMVPDAWRGDWPSAPLLKDEVCCVVSAENTDVPEVLDREAFSRLKVVFGQGAGLLQLMCSTLLRAPLRKDQIVATSDSLAGQLVAVRGTDLACFLPRRYVTALGGREDIRIVEAPGLVAPFEVHLAWHQARSRDAGISWMRGIIADAAAATELRYQRQNTAERRAADAADRRAALELRLGRHQVH